jgi:diguanylate cyclase (GGDEF)-like protein
MSDKSIRNFVNENLSPTAVYVLVSDTDELLYWPDNLKNSLPLNALKRYLSDKTVTDSFVIEQFDTEIPDLMIYVIVDQDAFMEPVRKQLYNLFLVLAICSVLIISISLILTRPVIRSLLEEQRMRELSRKDLLSGLYNRRVLNDLFVKEIARSKRYDHPLAVIMFDIDHFKTINDTYGHKVGDEVIRAIGNYCLKISRKNDFWIRYGGEEFLGVLPETDKEAVAVFSERLRSGIEQTTFKTSKGDLSVTVSGGYASFKLSKNTIIQPESMIDVVDQALYESKRTGRNKMVQSEGHT